MPSPASLRWLRAWTPRTRRGLSVNVNSIKMTNFKLQQNTDSPVPIKGDSVLSLTSIEPAERSFPFQGELCSEPGCSISVALIRSSDVKLWSPLIQ